MKKLLLTFASALMLVACGGQKEKKTNENATTDTTTPQEVVAKDVATLQVEKYSKYGITGLEIDAIRFEVKSNEKIAPEALKNEEACLNDLRFYGWTDDMWFDNNYLRTIRIFMDAYAAGEINQECIKNNEWESLEQYKDVMSSKFVAVEIEFPWLGGIMYYIVPLDNTKLVISAWVYSLLSKDSIAGYDIRHFEVKAYDEELIPKEDVAKLKAGELECIVW
jgi:hypothetical protein